MQLQLAYSVGICFACVLLQVHRQQVHRQCSRAMVVGNTPDGTVQRRRWILADVQMQNVSQVPSARV